MQPKPSHQMASRENSAEEYGRKVLAQGQEQAPPGHVLSGHRWLHEDLHCPSWSPESYKNWSVRVSLAPPAPPRVLLISVWLEECGSSWFMIWIPTFLLAKSALKISYHCYYRLCVYNIHDGLRCTRVRKSHAVPIQNKRKREKSLQRCCRNVFFSVFRYFPMLFASYVISSRCSSCASVWFNRREGNYRARCYLCYCVHSSSLSYFHCGLALFSL